MGQKLVELCKEGDLSKVKEHLETSHENIALNEYEAFHAACTHGHLELAKFLIKHEESQGKPIFSPYNRTNMFTFNVLTDSIRAQHFHMVEYLMTSEELRTRLDAMNHKKYVLEFICRHSNLDNLKWFTSIEFKEPLQIRQHKNEALMQACFNPDISLIDYLLTSPNLKRKSNIHAQDDRAFSIAAEKATKGNSKLLEYFIFDRNIERTFFINKQIKDKKLQIAENLFEKRELYKTLNKELVKEKESIKPKKMKL